MPIILLTDFGNTDPYVGVMKGVIAGLAPQTPILDLSHEVRPFDILQTSLVLGQSFSYFPKQSIFVVVVDPGVGSARRPLLVQTQEYAFIAPDNGVLTLALEEQKIERIIHLQNKKYFLDPISHTFHGRDIFAPVAAHLSRGVPPKIFGETILGYFKLPEWEPKISERKVTGQIIYIDHFGNAVTNFKRSFIEKHFPKQNPTLTLTTHQEWKLKGIHTHYEQGKPGEPILLFGSSDLLEISVNQGSAAEIMGIQVGQHHPCLSLPPPLKSLS